MQKPNVLFLVLASLALSGCHLLYRPTVQQGNVITARMIARLRLGMTKNEVVYDLGAPAIHDPFHPNRWDYYYSLKRNYKPLIAEHFTLYFKKGRLARIVGVPRPTPRHIYGTSDS
ncbi:MAG: outer membrane protein assembly factor BamE [Gammaproteobacteria bacterium]|nr:outer membrane protein assembly factor BamE [Gammaproteobacteria bacterium]